MASEQTSNDRASAEYGGTLAGETDRLLGPNTSTNLLNHVDRLQAALAAVTFSDQILAAPSVGALCLSLEQLAAVVATEGAGSGAAALAERLDVAMDRLDGPLGRIVDGISLRERSRHLHSLVERSGSLIALVDEVQLVVDPGCDPSLNRQRLIIAAQSSALEEFSEVLEGRLRALERTIAVNRDNEERRLWTLDRKLSEVDHRVGEGLQNLSSGIDASLEASTESFNALSKEIEGKISLHDAALNADLVSKLSGSYESAGRGERRAANVWRRVAVAFGSTGLVVFLFGLWRLGSLATLNDLLAHVGVSIVCGGLATYAARQSAEHRREERALRASRMRLANSISILFDMSPNVREDLTRGLVESIIREHARNDSDLSEAALSVLPIDKLIQLIKGGPSDPTQPDKGSALPGDQIETTRNANEQPPR